MCPQSCSLFTSVFWLRRWRPSRPSFQNSFNILSRARHVLKSLLICLRIRQRAYASRPLKAKRFTFSSVVASWRPWLICLVIQQQLWVHTNWELNICGKGFRILLSQNISLKESFSNTKKFVHTNYLVNVLEQLEYLVLKRLWTHFIQEKVYF